MPAKLPQCIPRLVYVHDMRKRRVGAVDSAVFRLCLWELVNTPRVWEMIYHIMFYRRLVLTGTHYDCNFEIEG